MLDIKILSVELTLDLDLSNHNINRSIVIEPFVHAKLLVFQYQCK